LHNFWLPLHLYLKVGIDLKRDGLDVVLQATRLRVVAPKRFRFLSVLCQFWNPLWLPTPRRRRVASEKLSVAPIVGIYSYLAGGPLTSPEIPRDLLCEAA